MSARLIAQIVSHNVVVDVPPDIIEALDSVYTHANLRQICKDFSKLRLLTMGVILNKVMTNAHTI